MSWRIDYASEVLQCWAVVTRESSNSAWVCINVTVWNRISLSNGKWRNDFCRDVTAHHEIDTTRDEIFGETRLFLKCQIDDGAGNRSRESLPGTLPLQPIPPSRFLTVAWDTRRLFNFYHGLKRPSLYLQVPSVCLSFPPLNSLSLLAWQTK